MTELFQTLMAPIIFIAPFLFVLTLIVFIHELGHFLVARWAGVEVSVFSVGFGPALLSRTDRQGTRWQLAAIPLGGYVKFLGDENAASVTDNEALHEMAPAQRSRTFAEQPVGKRAAIVAAGPIANFLLAIVIFAVIFTVFGRQVITPRVDEIVPDSAAAEAGLLPGDVVTAIDGADIVSFSDIQRIVSVSPGQELAVTVDRGGESVTLLATPRRQEITDRFGNTMNVGVLGMSRSTTAEDYTTQTFTPLEATWAGVKETWFVIDQSVTYLYRIVTGTESTEQLGGPIRIAEVSSQVATLGFVAIMGWAAVISVSIGFINLFPIPLLDGGHLVYYAAEAIRGKPLSIKAQEAGYRVGIVAIGALMIFAVWNDILRIVTR